ncbi:MAG: hypothetical protein AAGI88_13775 [Pseudomonadota bacterium]
MNKSEALGLLGQVMDGWEKRTYDQLASRIDTQPITGEKKGEAGEIYQYEVQFFWDGEPGLAVRIIGSIDDGGWRAYFPLTRSFIRNPSSESNPNIA